MKEKIEDEIEEVKKDIDRMGEIVQRFADHISKETAKAIFKRLKQKRVTPYSDDNYFIMDKDKFDKEEKKWCDD